MKLYDLYTRNAISRTLSAMQKKKKITQKQMISILHTTRERYVKYALKGLPSEHLEIILQELEIDIFYHMDLVDLYVREHMQNEIPPLNITSHNISKSTSIPQILYHEIKETWLTMNSDTTPLLDAWMKEYSIYYLYLLIVKQTFVTQNDLKVMTNYQFSLHDYTIFLYYGLRYTEIESMYENGTHDIYMYLIMKQLLQFYKSYAKHKDHFSLSTLINLVETTLL